ncbi:NAD(P)/FAD-dependent oxidoreductase [Burkholderia glumae]|uniref:FAD-binding oxidoreductase n=1 Tax=Burkholderia glumae TaxID=337 RepID=A0ABY5B7J1_BURGL|nr:FAD-binding oxidoreductase [Burkholderia glumae]ACR30598.1 FAD dependent oxidoreductase [Burkholderia glumae BGR1]KHJ62349.1 D-amino acid oxidase [Burkholderia glumae]MCM2484112.1 FAD-binding oxidoreductase [Burkholderia glumae]MCM2509802.1 FAD-binding oxidoreductase [Burkholderia glumae]MCM2539565.1 FAD-binding oxidoreductase [Burkholderia glumae]
MAPSIAPVATSTDLPACATVVVIGGGIVGLTAALTLAERGICVVVLEKGRLAGEQSSRNLGWVRKMGRAAPDVPMSLASDRLWKEMTARVGADVGYRQAGIMYLAGTAAEMAMHESWMKAVAPLELDSRLLTQGEIDVLVPGGRGGWAGGIFTPSDGRAEPTLASSAIANAMQRRGGVIVEHCAVRSLTLAAGRVSGVVTERGEIRCEQVLLAGGLWSRRFLGNLGVALPTLPLICHAIRTAPMQGPTEIAVGGPDFSFRKRRDGGFTITHRAALGAPLLLDHLLIGRRYLPVLKRQRHMLRLSLGRHFLNDLAMPRRWSSADVSPFERVRTMDPAVDDTINAQAMRNLAAAWPVFENARVEEVWAGMMDITPDSLPAIGPVAAVPGLTLAAGFSGHGFGTAPAAGQLAADLVMNRTPLIDPSPYRLERFA